MKNFTLIVAIVLTNLQLFAQTCNLDSEGFEAGLSAPTGWQVINSYIGNTNPRTGTNHAGFNTLGDILVVEPLTCPGQICFFWRASGTTSNYDIDVDWSTDGGINWNNAHKIILTGTASPTTYQSTCVNLPENLYPAPFTGILVRFHQSRRVSGSFYLDDVCIDAGTCTLTPTRLQISTPVNCVQSALPFSIEVCATDNAGNIATNYNGNIQLSINSGSGILGGITNVPANSGCASFNSVQISSPGSFSLAATDGNLSGTGTVFPVLSQCPNTDTLRVMSYNLLNFPNGRNDCGTNLVIPSRWDTLSIITDFVKPDILMVCELQNEVGADSILNRALNKNSNNNYRRAAFVPNQSPAGTNLNNMLFYNSNKLTLYRQSLLKTHLRDISYYTLLLNDPGLAAGNDSTFLDVFVAHLDAAAIDSLSRTRGSDTLRLYLDTAASPRNVIFGGDFNFYRSTESGYLKLLSGTRPLFDPINSPGDWTSNGTFSSIHTQATRSSTTTSMDCGALGGLDDRFDFILASATVMNGTNNIEYITGSYQSLANSGNIFNRSINDPLNNSAVPTALKNALFHMSDHLPVIMDLRVNFPSVLFETQILSFEGETKLQGNLLSWSLSENIENVETVLQRSTDGIYFYDLEKFYPEHFPTGYYEFMDYNASAKNYYRIRVQRKNDFLKTNILYLERNNPETANILLYPNPARETISILMQQNDEAYFSIEIYNSMGQLIKKVSSEDKFSSLIDVSELSSGIYYVRLSTMDGSILKSFQKL